VFLLLLRTEPSNVAPRPPLAKSWRGQNSRGAQSGGADGGGWLRPSTRYTSPRANGVTLGVRLEPDGVTTVRLIA